MLGTIQTATAMHTFHFRISFSILLVVQWVYWLRKGIIRDALILWRPCNPHTLTIKVTPVMRSNMDNKDGPIIQISKIGFKYANIGKQSKKSDLFFIYLLLLTIKQDNNDCIQANATSSSFTHSWICQSDRRAEKQRNQVTPNRKLIRTTYTVCHRKEWRWSSCLCLWETLLVLVTEHLKTQVVKAAESYVIGLFAPGVNTWDTWIPAHKWREYMKRWTDSMCILQLILNIRGRASLNQADLDRNAS